MTPLFLSRLPANAPWWMFALVVTGLALHIGAGSFAILGGYVAAFARKGARLHRFSGNLFVLSMAAMALMAVFLAIWIHQKANIIGGLLVFYLVGTAWMAVRRKPRSTGRFEVAALIAAIAITGFMLAWATEAAASPTGRLDGAPPAQYLVFAVFAAFAAALDFKVIRQGGVSGSARIARHLWRMCVALFFAAASFFLGQQKVMPAALHHAPILFVPALAPLAIMIWWLLRVRRQHFMKIIDDLSSPAERCASSARGRGPRSWNCFDTGVTPSPGFPSLAAQSAARRERRAWS